MFAYAIPLLTISCFTDTIVPPIRKFEKKSAILQERLQEIGRYFLQTDAEATTNPTCWHFDALSNLRILALGISALVGLDSAAQKEKIRDGSIYFAKNFSPHFFPTPPEWILNMWAVSFLAQAILCIFTPTSSATRMFSLTANFAFPVLFLVRYITSANNYKQQVAELQRYGRTYPFVDSDSKQKLWLQLSDSTPVYLLCPKNDHTFEPDEIRRIATALYENTLEDLILSKADME